MKIFMSVALTMFCFSASAQGLIFNEVQERPEFLSLEILSNSFSGIRIFHSEVDPISKSKTLVSTNFNSVFLKQFEAHLKKSSYTKVYCDGNYELKKDTKGIMYIDISRVKACIDENGALIAADPHGDEIPSVLAGYLYTKIKTQKQAPQISNTQRSHTKDDDIKSRYPEFFNDFDSKASTQK